MSVKHLIQFCEDLKKRILNDCIIRFIPAGIILIQVELSDSESY